MQERRPGWAAAWRTAGPVKVPAVRRRADGGAERLSVRPDGHRFRCPSDPSPWPHAAGQGTPNPASTLAGMDVLSVPGVGQPTSALP